MSPAMCGVCPLDDRFLTPSIRLGRFRQHLIERDERQLLGYVVGTLSKSFCCQLLTTTPLLSGDCLATVWSRSGQVLATFCLLSGDITEIVWRPSCDGLVTFFHFLTTIWSLSGHPSSYIFVMSSVAMSQVVAPSLVCLIPYGVAERRARPIATAKPPLSPQTTRMAQVEPPGPPGQC